MYYLNYIFSIYYFQIFSVLSVLCLLELILLFQLLEINTSLLIINNFPYFLLLTFKSISLPLLLFDYILRFLHIIFLLLISSKHFKSLLFLHLVKFKQGLENISTFLVVICYSCPVKLLCCQRTYSMFYQFFKNCRVFLFNE